MLEDEVEGHVYCIVNRSVDSVGELQGVQERVCDGPSRWDSMKMRSKDFITTEVRATGL